MNSSHPVTLAHSFVSKLIQPGDRCVDATVGNGHDTVFLAHLVGTTGHVLGIDVQRSAIDSARRRLQQQGLEKRVFLKREGHEKVGQRLKALGWSRIKIAMFNLGYLPGSDKRVITRSSTTLPAMRECLKYLAPQGAMSIVAYRGHAGGLKEYHAVLSWVVRLDSWNYHSVRYQGVSATGPVFMWIQKKG